MERLKDALRSNFPLRDIGFSDTHGIQPLAEENRSLHMHLMGSPQEGKSAFLQQLMRGDIDRLVRAYKTGTTAPGFCFIDGTELSGTAKEVLRYCAYRGYYKVIYINPRDMFKYGVPCINPFEYLHPRAAITLITDSFQNMWEADWKDNSRLRRHMSSLLMALVRTGYTLQEAKWFMSDHPEYIKRQKYMLQRTNEKGVLKFNKLQLERIDLEQSFRNQQRFDKFESTINRMDTIFHDKLELILGSKHGLNFEQLIRDGYIILAGIDLSAWGNEAQAFFGILLMNMVMAAKQAMIGQDSGYHVPYYLYIDEVGQFANPKLTELLDYKRHLDIGLVVSHQRLDQIQNKNLHSALYGGSAKLQILFNTQNPDDALAMAKLMFGGALTDREVSQVLRKTEKQECWIKFNKQDSRNIRIKDLLPIKISDEELNVFKEQVIYNKILNPYYRPIADIRKEIDDRFAGAEFPSGYTLRSTPPTNTRKDSSLPGAGSATDGKPVSSESENTHRVKPRTVPDNPSSSGPILQRPARRTSSKRNPKQVPPSQ